MKTSNTYGVKGMTCGHCVSAVTAELEKLAGVNEVDVDLDTGEVTVISDSALDLDAVQAAVDEAGYGLVT